MIPLQSKVIFTLFAILSVSNASVCSANQYKDPSTSLCLSCDISCSSCSGTSTNCTSCSLGYYSNVTSCVSCPSACSNCTSSSVCTSCQLEYYLGTNSSCVSCGKNCMLCNSTQCSQCIAGYKLQDNCTSCNREYYFNSTRNSCELCNQGCQDCSSKQYCTSCQNNYRLMVDGSCLYLGSDNSYKDDGQAEQGSQHSQMNVFIILGSVLGGLVFIFCIVGCICYSKSRKQKKKIKAKTIKTRKVNSISQNKLKADKQFQQSCCICNSRNPEMLGSCGHTFHSQCYQVNPSCPRCRQDLSIAETHGEGQQPNNIEMSENAREGRKTDEYEQDSYNFDIE